MAQEQKAAESNYDYDVLIVGGGPAGLSAALTLGRFLHKVLVCDDNRPRNLKSLHANNLPISDGINPMDWRAKARSNLKKYETVTVEDGARVLTINPVADSPTTLFKAEISSSGSSGSSGASDAAQTRTISCRKVILAYGMVDQVPEPKIEGFDECWGKSVLHCPFCHGWEVRSKKLAFLIEMKMMASHLAPVLLGLSKNLIVFTNGKTDMLKGNAADDHDYYKIFKQKGVQVIDDKVVALKYDKKSLGLEGVVLEGGKVIERDALFYGQSIPIKLKSDLGQKLGCEMAQSPPFGHLKVGDRGETNVKGVYAAGDCMAFSSVLQSASDGQNAAGGIVFTLAEENFEKM